MNHRAQRAVAALVALCGLLVVVGSVGPWGTRLGWIEIDGMDGDGKVTVVLGAVALALGVLLVGRPAMRWPAALAAAVLLLTAAIGAADWRSVVGPITGREAAFLGQLGIQTLPEGGVGEVGWGLALLTVAAGAGAALATLQAVLRYRSRRRAASGLPASAHPAPAPPAGHEGAP